MENSKIKRKASLVINNQIVEMVYDSANQKAEFVSYENGEITRLDVIKNSNGEFQPLDGRSDLITKNIILFPSEPVEYETNEKIIEEIRVFIHKYLDISPKFEEISSYYVMLSWLYDRFNEVPYLRALGDLGSGKSRFLRTIGSICYKPIFTGGATSSAPIFRILNDIGGTLVLDEADYKSSETTDDIVKILNMGFQKGGSVLRCDANTYEVKAYDVYSPKIVGTRETFSDSALESRFLVEEMGIGILRTDIPHRLPDEFYEEARMIRNKLLMWRFRNYFKPLAYHEGIISGITPRLQQIAIPILSIIESDEVKEKFKEFIQNYNQELIADRGQSRESEIVFTILKLEHDIDKKEFTMKEISNAINHDTELEFKDMLSPKKIGYLLRKKLQLKSRRTSNGWILDTNKNRERLDFWKERFGIIDENLGDSEHMNVMNIAEDGRISEEELLKIF